MAARTETSKRSLCAHFESKDELVGAAIGLVRELCLRRLGTPAEYAADPAEAIVRYCGRFLQRQLWTSSLRTLRLGIVEAKRLPNAASQFHEAIFEIRLRRLAAFLTERCWPDADASREAAHRLIGRAIYPQMIRALLGVDEPLPERPDEATLADDVDLEPLRAAVAPLLPFLRDEG